MLKLLLAQRDVLVAPGVYDGLSATLAARAGFDVVYMSGFSVAGATYGVPDVGIIGANEMAEAADRIVRAAGTTPVIADADNGYGGPLNVARIVERYEQLGVACIQIEDQVLPKRCGHMENKQVVGRKEATARIRAAVKARQSTDFLVMARTDAAATDGLGEALRRAEDFLHAGADILFVEAPRTESDLRRIGETFAGTPLVLNLVEDGKTPWLVPETARELGFRIVLYPVTALLHAAEALSGVYEVLRAGGAPTSARMKFGDFNQLVGLDRLNGWLPE
ncbi:MAG: isocitrate lyase/PEP mutase family protein [Pseudomonadales bacterium]|nr:isocitrate lyase/PEP mutase family protein [Pseudomonadales bacterium]